MKLAYTRAMVQAALSGRLDNTEMSIDPVFGFEIPKYVPDVPDEVLNARSTWPNPADYDARAADLAARFAKYMQQFEGYMSEDVKAAAPKVPVH